MNVEIAGRTIELSSLDRVLWPAVSGTKADLVKYVTDMAEPLLRHAGGHPVTLHRFPEGVGGPHFYQTRAPARPDWVRTVTLRTPRLNKVFDVVVIDDGAGLVWSANLSTIELHPYLGTAAAFYVPTAMVFDLDPGEPADVITCCDVALVLRGILDGVGLRSFPKVSGAKGLHIHVPVAPSETFDRTKEFAQAVAGLLARELPDVIVRTMSRHARPGRVFVDWSQNDPWKSIVAPYSLRGGDFPTVAAPVSWDEVERATEVRNPGDLVFLAWEMPDRLASAGDLFDAAAGLQQSLPSSA